VSGQITPRTLRLKAPATIISISTTKKRRLSVDRIYQGNMELLEPDHAHTGCQFKPPLKLRRVEVLEEDKEGEESKPGMRKRRRKRGIKVTRPYLFAAKQRASNAALCAQISSRAPSPVSTPATVLQRLAMAGSLLPAPLRGFYSCTSTTCSTPLWAGWP